VSPVTGMPGWFVPAFGGREREPGLVLSDLLRRQWPWLLLLPLLFAAGAVLYVVRAPFIYESSVLLAPAEEESSGGLLGSISGQLGSISSLVGADLGGGTQMKDRALAIMRSRSFSDRFIRERGLLAVMFASRWDAQRKAWIGPAPSADESFEEFDRRVRFISEDRKAGFVRVAMRARDPELAAQWAASFVSDLNAHMRAQASSEANRNLEFLNRELAQTTVVGVQQSLYRLIETQVRNKMLASVREEYAFRVIDPALPPAPDRYVSPRRLLVVALAMVAGLILALVVAVLRETARQTSSSTSPPRT
jgi:uncharacterized protein involved in exopolysaccharide biosynthesis